MAAGAHARRPDRCRRSPNMVRSLSSAISRDCSPTTASSSSSPSASLRSARKGSGARTAGWRIQEDAARPLLVRAVPVGDHRPRAQGRRRQPRTARTARSAARRRPRRLARRCGCALAPRRPRPARAATPRHPPPRSGLEPGVRAPPATSSTQRSTAGRCADGHGTARRPRASDIGIPSRLSCVRRASTVATGSGACTVRDGGTTLEGVDGAADILERHDLVGVVADAAVAAPHEQHRDVGDRVDGHAVVAGTAPDVSGSRSPVRRMPPATAS